MFRRYASVVAGGVVALASYSVIAGAPASGQQIEIDRRPNTVEVTKVVKGTNPGGSFTVVVKCEQRKMIVANTPMGGGSVTETLLFGPDGGEKDVKAAFGSTCTVAETGTGGASHVEIIGSPCEFNKDTADSEAARVDGKHETCKVTVTNTFDPPLPGPPGPPGQNVASVVAAQPVVVVPQFTG